MILYGCHLILYGCHLILCRFLTWFQMWIFTWLRVTGFIWLRMSQIYDYEYRRYDYECRDLYDYECRRRRRFFRMSWSFRISWFSWILWVPQFLFRCAFFLDLHVFPEHLGTLDFFECPVFLVFSWFFRHPFLLLVDFLVASASMSDTFFGWFGLDVGRPRGPPCQQEAT